MDKPEFQITADTGKILKNWAEKGVEVKPSEPDQSERAQQEVTQAEQVTISPVSGKCQYCGTTNKYHKKGCPNAV